MIAGLHKIRRILSAPIPFLARRTANRAMTSLLKIRKTNLKNELHKTDRNPNFPDFFNARAISKETADKICEHKFDLLGSGLKNLGAQIDWQKDFRQFENYDSSICGFDIKIPWELSRFQFLPALAAANREFKNEKYAIKARNLIEDWIFRNPLGKGTNWACAMEAAIRAANWALAAYNFGDSTSWKNPEFLEKFLISIIQHGKFVYRNLEYGPGYNSNHLIANFTGLFFLGVLFPQFKESKKWLKKAIAGMEKEMRGQVYEDGADAEASIPYHGLVCEFFGYSALLAKENNIYFSPEFLKRLEKMFEFVFYYTKPDGLAPQIGDGDDGRLFIFEDFYSWNKQDHNYLFALAHALFPLNTKFVQNGQKQTSKGFNYGQIYVMRANDFYCVVDCGKNGQNGNGGHAHNDTFSFELSAGGEDFIIDSGTYVYNGAPEQRDKFRGTRMHNTVMIDGREMNRFRKGTMFGLHEDAIPTINKWDCSEARDILDAQYTDRRGVMHRRTFEFDKKNLKLRITDFVLKKGAHTAEWNFHFTPGIELQKNGTEILASKNGVKIKIELPLKLADGAEIREDEISPSYGIKQKAKTLTINANIATDENPFYFTVLPA